MGKNVVELVRRFVAPPDPERMDAPTSSQPDFPALLDRRPHGTRWTFQELVDQIDGVAHAARSAGLRPQDRCAVFVDKGPEFVAAVFGLLQAGVIPVLIDPGMGVRNVLQCIAEQRPRGLLGIAKAHVLRTMARRAFKSVEVALFVGRQRGLFPSAHPVLQPNLPPVPADARGRVHVPDTGETAAILYTSGSTGAPKGVVYTHEMLIGQTEAIGALFDIKPQEVDVACFLPFGLFSVAMGMTVVFPDMDFRFPAKADPGKILAALDGATSAFASPALWEPFSHFVDQRNIALALRRVLTAGAPVRPELHERLLRHLPHGDVFTPYGATEALPVALMNGRAVVDETAALTRAGHGTCVGRPAPGVIVQIIAISDGAIEDIADARMLAAGEPGEIIVRGACVTRAYDNRPEANHLSKIRDGQDVWHRMGDVGTLDESGRLWFLGRKAHRVVKADGTSLHSIPVEAVAEATWGWPCRAALVGVGNKGDQRAVLLQETGSHRIRFTEGGRKEVLFRLREAGFNIDHYLLYPGFFPVDRRHNAKIERERLAVWASEHLHRQSRKAA